MFLDILFDDRRLIEKPVPEKARVRVHRNLARYARRHCPNHRWLFVRTDRGILVKKPGV
jgi:hypothetical protein